MRTVLFICTGNTCRSPLAEAIAQDWMRRTLPAGGADYLAVSAGTSGGGGGPVSPETLRALETLGISHDGRSKRLTAEMIRAAEVVFGMTDEHVAAARKLVDGEPEQVRKIRRLDPDGETEDPIGHGQAAYDRLARHFRDLVPRRLEEVLAHEDRAGVGSSGN